MSRFLHAALIAALIASCSAAATTPAAELVTLTPETWDEFAPRGKEVDCIYGDYVLRNESIVVVIAKPVGTRNANMTVRSVGGAIIDLTRRDELNDQLSAYYPCASRYAFTLANDTVAITDGKRQSASQNINTRGKTVSLECKAAPVADKPQVTVRYTVADGQPYVSVETICHSSLDKPIVEELTDAMRADRTFTFGADAKTNLFWAHDEFFRQAYGIVVEGYEPRRSSRGATLIEYVKDGKASVTIEPGATFTLARRIFPGANLFDVRGSASRLAGSATKRVTIQAKDSAGLIDGAMISLTAAGDQNPYASGRADENGTLSFDLSEGKYEVSVAALGRPTATQAIDTAAADQFTVQLEPCGYVVAEITDESGGPIPCKVAFHGKDGTADPNFGPDSATYAIQNLYYSHTGAFRQEIGPGQYDVIVSYGPEYDAVYTEIEVQRGKETRLEAKLIRSVDTTGWVSSDFHSHSSPSGDNTSSQLGRVLNLLCEHIEFAPCTEHNRIDTYVPHLKLLGVEHLMATCTGMELTGSPLPVNHQNAFPLLHKPHTQDGGAPVTDANPILQIERLALWDNNSDKLVQGNHPNLAQIIGDKDLDGKPDGGFEKMFGFMDVVEVHPPQGIFTPPTADPGGRDTRNPIFHWMQMLNLGYRVPGVVNTDAHYNFHGSGFLRNYLKSPTDDPAKVETMDMVHTSEAGHVIMTNGPFLEVRLKALAPAASGEEQLKDKSKSQGIPGDDVSASGGKAEVYVRIQCPNWLDVNRVQIFLNGRPEKKLNFTRRETPDRFGNGVVKFDATLPLELKSDTHVIVATTGEDLQLGPVMGPTYGLHIPTAVSNPIFVDIDGNGFQPNGDLLDFPLPLREPQATSGGK